MKVVIGIRRFFQLRVRLITQLERGDVQSKHFVGDFVIGEMNSFLILFFERRHGSAAVELGSLSWADRKSVV